MSPGRALVGALAWLAMSACAPKDVTPLRLGFFSYFSNGGEVLGIPLKEATENAVNAINQSGGVDGAPIELYIQDPLATGDVNEGWDLLMQHAPQAVIASLATPHAQQLLPRWTSEQVITFLPSNTSPTLDGDDFNFRTAPSDTVMALGMTQYLRRQGVTKATVIYGDTPTGQAVRDTFVDTFSQIGGALTGPAIPMTMATEGPYAVDDAVVANAMTAALAQSPQWLVGVGFGSPGPIGYWRKSGQAPGLTWLLPDAASVYSIYQDIPGIPAGSVRGLMPVNPAKGDAFKSFEAARTFAPGKDVIYDGYGPKVWDSVYLFAAAALHQRVNFRSPIGGADLKASLVAVSKGGQVMHAGQWQDIVALVRGKGDVDYDGAGGPVDFDDHGEVLGPYAVWQLEPATAGYKLGQLDYFEARDLPLK